jgi:hypothetical protein
MDYESKKLTHKIYVKGVYTIWQWSASLYKVSKLIVVNLGMEANYLE